jgi:hypothetical protein
MSIDVEAIMTHVEAETGMEFTNKDFRQPLSYRVASGKKWESGMESKVLHFHYAGDDLDTLLDCLATLEQKFDAEDYTQGFEATLPSEWGLVSRSDAQANAGDWSMQADVEPEGVEYSGLTRRFNNATSADIHVRTQSGQDGGIIFLDQTIAKVLAGERTNYITFAKGSTPAKWDFKVEYVEFPTVTTLYTKELDAPTEDTWVELEFDFDGRKFLIDDVDQEVVIPINFDTIEVVQFNYTSSNPPYWDDLVVKRGGMRNLGAQSIPEWTAVGRIGGTTEHYIVEVQLHV